MLPVQFITHQTDFISYEESALMALKGGCKWIQLRMDGATDAEVEPIAQRLKVACREFSSTFVIDGRVELVRKLEVDGVHLGEQDISVREARSILGEGFLIGGTAHTYADIVELKRQTADYVHCGPFIPTPAQEEASCYIGLERFLEIIKQMEADDVFIPICAMGAIRMEDVPELMRTGVNGIAVGQLILQSAHPVAAMQSILAL